MSVSGPQSHTSQLPWGRAFAIGFLVVLVGYLLLHFEPRIRRPTCRNLVSYAAGPGGNHATSFSYVCFPVYFYCLAALIGSGGAAIVTLRRITIPRAFLFIVLCDVFTTWIAGTALLVWDRFQPHATLPSPEAFWFLLLPFGLVLGAVFGNVTTLGFPLWSGAAALLVTIAAEAVYCRLGSVKPAR